MFQEPDYTTPLGRLSLRAKRVPGVIRIPLLFIALAGICLSIFADVGPYPFFAGLQAASLDGEHYLFLSGALTVIVVLVPTGIVIQLLAGLFKDNRPAYMMVNEPLPPHAGPLPAYMVDGPYAQPLPGQAPRGQAPHGQVPTGQVPYGQAPAGQVPYGQVPYGQSPHGQGPQGRGK